MFLCRNNNIFWIIFVWAYDYIHHKPTVGLTTGKNTGMSLEEQGINDDSSMEISTNSLAAKDHHFFVATATLPWTNKQP